MTESMRRFCIPCGYAHVDAYPHCKRRAVEIVASDLPSLFDATSDLGEVVDPVVPAEVAHAAQARQDESIEARFLTFHTDNPRVYELLVRFARELRDRGYDHAGMKAIWERMRWEMALQTLDPDGFKLNNDYTSRYARLIMATERDLAGFFRTRELRSA